MSLKPVSRTTLGELVARQLVDMITAGRWKAGEKLPSEAELCRALNIGRSTLREALKSLAFLGMVRMRAGEGTYVADGPSTFFERVLTTGFLTTDKQISDLCETRIALEGELVALCAQRAPDGDVERLKAIVIQMDHCLDSEVFTDLDLEFHMAIASASQNQVLDHMLRTIRSLLREWIIKSQQTPGSQQTANEQHAAILEAVVRRSPSRARSAMTSHLQTFQRGYALMRTVSYREQELVVPQEVEV